MQVCACVCVCVCVCVYEYVCMQMCIYVCIIEFKQTIIYTCSYIAINKTNKQKKAKKVFAVVGGGTDQFCWGARAKMTVLKFPKQSLWSSIERPYHFS